MINKNGFKTFKTIYEYSVVVLAAVVMSLCYELLIFPNAFAPAGINGVATIIQHRFNFSVGYMSLIINAPLLVAAYFKSSRSYTLKTAIYVLLFSLITLAVKNGNGDDTGFIDLSEFAYYSQTSKILAPIAAGAILGFVTGVLVRTNGSTGGTDIIARLIRVKRPELNIFWIIFGLNTVVAVLSYFEYRDYDAVILCILYSLTSAAVGDMVLRGSKSALKFEVVTSHPDEISDDIIATLRHTATVVRAEGMFTRSEKSLLVCVINKNQIAEFEKILKKYPDTFAYVSNVNETVGNFKKIK